MAWIESHTELARHRKVIGLACELGLRRVEVVGHLTMLWHGALEQQEDGDLSRWPDPFIAEVAAYPGDASGFVTALKKHNWIEKNGLLHHWLDYAGKYLHSKYHTSNPKKLKAIFRLHKSAFKRPKGQPKGDPPNLPNQHNLTYLTLPEWLDEKVWEDFKTFRKRSRRPLTARAEELAVAKLSQLRAAGQDPRAVIEQSILNGWQGLFPLKSNGAGAVPQEPRDLRTPTEKLAARKEIA